MATGAKPASVLLSLSGKEKNMERIKSILDSGSLPRQAPRRGVCRSRVVVGLFATAMAVCQQAAVAAQPERGGHTHLAVFTSVGEFQPRTPIELLKKLNATLVPAKVMTGYFRTWPEKDRLVGGICTNDPKGLSKVIDKIPELKLVSTEALTDKSFDRHTKRKQESLGWTTPQGGYAYLTVFRPVGDFRPTTPVELLNKLNKTLQPAKVRTGYFRTWPENGRLVGAICTDDAEGLKGVLKKIPELEWGKTDILNKKAFAKHSERRQQALH